MKRTATALAILGALAAGALWWWATSPNDAPLPAPRPIAAPTPEAPVPGTTAPEPIREPVNHAQTAPAAERPSDYAQGLRGLAVTSDGRPLGGVSVYLFESPHNEPLLLPVLLQRGLGMGPLAETTSGADGTFAIGLQLADEKLYELRLLAADFADTRIGDLRVLPGEWHDLGALVMAQGTTVRGRVTIEGTTTPVVQATVAIEASTVFEDVAMRALPGRERGLAATVDARGEYEIRNAPARGVVQLSAVAPGFAKVVRTDIELSAGRTTVVDFALLPGLALSGDVVDPAGRPIPRARLEAWPMRQAQPPVTGWSRNDGRFDLYGLAAGTYRLRILARGYQDRELPDLMAGRGDVHVTMAPRATLRLRVRGPEGQVLHSYQIGVRRSFAANDPFETPIGLVAELPDQRIRLDGFTEYAEVPGLPPGRFQVEVNAEGTAKVLSEPFDVATDTASVEVEVRLHRGATLRGRVLDELGRPVAEATVETQPDGALPDNPFLRAVAGAAPDRITRRKVTTGPSGDFELPMLALASYQLQIEHPETCRAVVPGLRLDQAGERTLPPVTLVTGAEITGRATVGGKAVGQMKVVLTSAVEAGAPNDVARRAVRLETVTDHTGAFRMPRRVPPGSYELRAAVVGASQPDAQVFQMLLQLQRSSTTFSVAPGQRTVLQNLDLPTDH